MASTINVPPTRVLDGLAAAAFVADVSVAVTHVPEWTDALIDRYLTELTALGHRAPSRGSLTRFLGSVPGASHRRRIAEWLEREGLSGDTRAALLTDSAVMRGALTAYSWVSNTEARAFAVADLASAAVWLCRGCVADPELVRRACVGCHTLLGVRLEPG